MRRGSDVLYVLRTCFPRGCAVGAGQHAFVSREKAGGKTHENCYIGSGYHSHRFKQCDARSHAHSLGRCIHPGGNLMTARIMEDFQVLQRYRVMVLDRDACLEASARYRINGAVYEPVRIHTQKASDTMPKNYIAVRSTESFKGASVEFV